MAAAPPPLPRLAFGNATAEVSDDLDAFTAAQRAAMPAIRRYEPLHPAQPFLHRSAAVRIGDVKLVASASTPLSVTADDSTETTLLVPFHGWGTSVVAGREYRWQAGSSAMFLPGSARTGASGIRSVLAISFDPRRLEATARTMLGPRDHGPVDLGLRTARLVPIGAPRSPALSLLKHALPLIDVAGGDPVKLRMLGLDDLLLRIVALMLAPEKLGQSFVPPRTGDSAAALRRVTEYIVEHLNEPIVLGDLEHVGGLSARSLQLAFRKAHGCSPREWIQRRRLLVARDRLRAAGPNDTVGGIAIACGFTRMSTFAAAYTRRFGESPSATLSGARRQ